MFILVLSSSVRMLSQPQKSGTLWETCFKIKRFAKVYPEFGEGDPCFSYPEVIRCDRKTRSDAPQLVLCGVSVAVSSGNKFSHLFLGRETCGSKIIFKERQTIVALL